LLREKKDTKQLSSWSKTEQHAIILHGVQILLNKPQDRKEQVLIKFLFYKFPD